MSSISYAKQILEAEAAAITQISSLLNEDFDRAIDSILQCKGRVVVCGMGKSGLIGEKLSATLASTGTPSLSLHPAEAVHGDLGKVVEEDLVIALSNGGETVEVLRLLPLLKKIGVTVIAITGKPESTLAKYSDISLNIGKTSEVCPLGLAPTTSTTAMLALGDAVAMCVSKKRNFTREEYALFHPGGSLGRKLMTVAEVMRTGDSNPTAKANNTVMEVLVAITKARAGAITIVNDEKKIIGIFTDGDFRRHFQQGMNLDTLQIKEVMTKNPLTAKSDLLVEEAYCLLKEKKIDELPIVDNNNVCVGMLDVQDLLEIF